MMDDASILNPRQIGRVGFPEDRRACRSLLGLSARRQLQAVPALLRSPIYPTSTLRQAVVTLFDAFDVLP